MCIEDKLNNNGSISNRIIEGKKEYVLLSKILDAFEEYKSNNKANMRLYYLILFARMHMPTHNHILIISYNTSISCITCKF